MSRSIVSSKGALISLSNKNEKVNKYKSYSVNELLDLYIYYTDLIDKGNGYSPGSLFEDIKSALKNKGVSNYKQRALERSFTYMKSYLSGSTEYEDKLNAGIRFAAKYGAQSTIKKYSDPDWNRFDNDILAWTNYWNHTFNKIDSNRVNLDANYIKAMIAVESQMGTSTLKAKVNNKTIEYPRKNCHKDVMQSMVLGDFAFWMATKKSGSDLATYKSNGKNGEVDIYIRDLDLLGSVDANKFDSNEKNSFENQNFGVLNSLFMKNQKDNKGNKIKDDTIDYCKVTPRMSIAVGIVHLDGKTNNTIYKTKKRDKSKSDANYLKDGVEAYNGEGIGYSEEVLNEIKKMS